MSESWGDQITEDQRRQHTAKHWCSEHAMTVSSCFFIHNPDALTKPKEDDTPEPANHGPTGHGVDCYCSRCSSAYLGE